jgi:hypothetical protein
VEPLRAADPRQIGVYRLRARLGSGGMGRAGQPTGYFDVFDYIELCKNHYERAGIGADYIEGLFR